jgi:hypothetical protein
VIEKILFGGYVQVRDLSAEREELCLRHCRLWNPTVWRGAY